MKIHDPSDLKFDTIVVLDTVSKPIDFDFKRSSVRGTGPSFPTFGTSCHLVHKTDYCLYIDNYTAH